MFLAYGIGMIFRVAQGSGTVAGMTSMGIMATIAPAIGCHPVWIALACLSGGNSIGHVNDSGYWVATNMSGLTVTGGLKTYTLVPLSPRYVSSCWRSSAPWLFRCNLNSTQRSESTCVMP